MLLSIAGMSVFLFYWLKESYDREAKALDINSFAAFEQSIRQLQVSRLNLGNSPEDSMPQLHVRKLIKDSGEHKTLMLTMPAKTGIVSTINVIQGKLKDPRRDSGRVMISINETAVSRDSLRSSFGPLPTGPNRFVELLYNIDSLQEPLKRREIDSAFSMQLVKEKINIPFSILETTGTAALNEPADNAVTIGFANPVTYKLDLGNTAPYLLKRITLPIIFSLLLLAVTVLAFVLLYRNLVKQKRLGEIRNEFISNISHELKTPVATVGVAIEALKNFSAMADPQRTKEYLDISSNELQRLNLLIDKVLKLSLFEKKEMELTFETVNMQEIVEEVLMSLKLQFEKYQAAVTLNASGDLGLTGDRLHLQSVVFNLLDNALKYGKEKPEIQIELSEKDKHVEFRIKDNGIGIAPEYRDKIFEKFFRVPHGDTHDAKGYGLGLSYAAQVIKKHNGSINVQSQPGAGTTFIIHLPKQLS